MLTIAQTNKCLFGTHMYIKQYMTLSNHVIAVLDCMCTKSKQCLYVVRLFHEYRL